MYHGTSTKVNVQSTIHQICEKENLLLSERRCLLNVLEIMLEYPEVCSFEIANLRVNMTEDETYSGLTYYCEIVDLTKSELNNTIVTWVSDGERWNVFTEVYS